MTMNIHIVGIKEVNHFFLNLPKKMDKEVMVSSEEFMRFIQRSAKIRAPRNSGKLAQSINIKGGKNTIGISVDSPYAYFQEFGFAPHWIHSSMPNRSGGTVGSSLKKRGFIFVQNFKPFITPALEIGLSRLPMFLERATDKAVIKSRR